MSDESQVRQDLNTKPKAPELSAEEDRARIENMKATHTSHHTAGGCAEDQPKSVENAKDAA